MWVHLSFFFWQMNRFTGIIWVMHSSRVVPLSSKVFANSKPYLTGPLDGSPSIYLQVNYDKLIHDDMLFVTRQSESSSPLVPKFKVVLMLWDSFEWLIVEAIYSAFRLFFISTWWCFSTKRAMANQIYQFPSKLFFYQRIKNDACGGERKGMVKTFVILHFCVLRKIKHNHWSP